MNCFELIKTVLDKLYAAISGTAAKKDDAIKKRLELFSKQYPSLLNGVRIDYKQPVSRFAYVYRYTTAHANMVTCSIQNNDTLRSLLEKEKFTVACVGGGPGSDFLGILKYLERNGGCGMRHLKCHLIDQEKAWDNCWSDLDEEIRSTGRLSTHFKPIDVTDPTSYDPVEERYMRAELFTFVYFMSELYARKTMPGPTSRSCFEE